MYTSGASDMYILCPYNLYCHANGLFKMNALKAFIFNSFLRNYQANSNLGKYSMKAS